MPRFNECHFATKIQARRSFLRTQSASRTCSHKKIMSKLFVVCAAVLAIAVLANAYSGKKIQVLFL
jgi:hypothetical protein